MCIILVHLLRRAVLRQAEEPFYASSSPPFTILNLSVVADLTSLPNVDCPSRRTSMCAYPDATR
eukprot:scaffold282997_cov19-Prasinocladus_malaysianus.AAC.1